ARAPCGLVLALEQAVRGTREPRSIAVAFEDRGELQPGDNGVLMFAEDILDAGCPSDEPACPLGRGVGQDWGHHLGGIAGPLGELANLVERLVRVAPTERAGLFLEPAPGRGGERRQRRPAGRTRPGLQ